MKKGLNIALLTGLVALLVSFTSCGKDEPTLTDTNKEKIAALEAEIAKLVGDSVQTLNQARAALEPALTDPYDIKLEIFEKMNNDLTVPRETFLDTLNYIIDAYARVSDDWMLADWGVPNKTNMGTYFVTGESFRQIVKRLSDKRDELKSLKNPAIAKAAVTNVQNKDKFDTSVTKQYAIANKSKNTPTGASL